MLEVNNIYSSNLQQCSIFIFLFSNIAHCYNKKQDFRRALDYSFKAIEAKPDFWRAYRRCVESFIGEEKPRMAAVTLLKAEASINNTADRSKLNTDLPQIDKKESGHAEKYVKDYYQNKPRDINLKRLFERGFKNPPIQKSPDLPQLVVSDADDSDSDSEGPRRPVSNRSQKKPPVRTENDRVKSIKGAAKNVKENKAEVEAALNPVPESMVQAIGDNQVVGIFKAKIKEASQCYMNSIPKRSKDLFGEALDIVQTNYQALQFSQPLDSCEDVVVIKFIYGRACTGMDSYQDIIVANDIFHEILNVHKKVRFPAVYLGLALMFKKLNRFEEALKFLERGCSWFDKGLSCVTQSFPGHPTKRIDETNPTSLQQSFKSLRQELRLPPKPDAICRYQDCRGHRKHLVPSDKIYLTDPDFRTFYRVMCRTNCVLEFHESCWTEKKSEFKEGVKIPSERDFFGKRCFTPDCGSIIIKIIIYESCDGDPKVIEDKKLNEKIEQEDLLKRNAEKSRREKEAEEYRQKNFEERNNKKKSKKKRIERSTESSEKDNSRDDAPPKIESLIPDNNHDFNNSIPEIPLPLENMRKYEKNPNDDKENEGDIDSKKKVKKNKEKTTPIPLDVFNGPNNVPSQLNSYGERITKLQSIKRSVEVGLYDEVLGAGAVPYVSDSSKAKMLAQAKDQIPRETVEESIKTFVEEKLRKLGPMKESDKRLANFDEETTKLIKEKNGLYQVLRSDERFGIYGSYICLKVDAEKAKKLMDAEEKSKIDHASASRPSLGNVVKSVKEKLGNKTESFGLAQAAEAASELEKVFKNADESAKSIIDGMPELREIRSEFCQTDISSLDLDEADDPFTLKQSITVLTEELQETKDKFIKIQNEKKMESREFNDKINILAGEKLILQDETTLLRETIQKKEALYKEVSRKEKEMKALKDNSELAARKIAKLESDLGETRERLESEQRISFQLNLKAQKMTEQESLIARLKLKCLQTDFDCKNSFFLRKKADNEKLILHLSQMKMDGQSQPGAAVKAAIDKLNLYAAELIAGLDELQMKYHDRRLAIEQNSSTNLELDVDMGRLESPGLDIVEIDTLKLLASISLTSARSPQPLQPPFPSQSRSAGAIGPPPGLLASLSGEAGAVGAAVGGFRPNLAPGSSPNIIRQPPPPILFPHPSHRPVGSVPRQPPVPSPPPAAAVEAGPPGPQESKRIRNTHRLISQLLAKLPDLTAEQADKYIQILRERNHGKLSGLSVVDIKNGVEELWKKDVGAAAVVGFGRGKQGEKEEVAECSICLDPVSPVDPQYKELKPCKHRFHDSCIRVSLAADLNVLRLIVFFSQTWLNSERGAGNTCPNCRNYIVDVSTLAWVPSGLDIIIFSRRFRTLDSVRSRNSSRSRKLGTYKISH